MRFASKLKKSIVSRSKTGVGRLLRMRFGSCAVLLYHRVANLETDPQLLAVSKENFERQLKALKRSFHVLSVAEFKHHLDVGRKFPPKSVLITFDDGYSDNLENALPLLEANQSEAIVYICTGNLGTDQEFWWDEMEQLFLTNNNFPGQFEVVIDSVSYCCQDTITSRKELYDNLLPVLRAKNFQDRQGIFSSMKVKLHEPEPRNTHRSLSESELKKLSLSSFITIGAHSVNHCSLAALDLREQKEEVVSSIATIERIIQKKIVDFSFPFGTKNDFNKATIEICSKSGMKYIAANIPGCIHSGSDRYSFPRFLIRNWSEQFFVDQLNQFFRK